MKKILAVLAVMALIGTTAFAQELAVGASARVGFGVWGGSHGSESVDPQAFIGQTDVNFNFRAESADGTFGGGISFGAGNDGTEAGQPVYAVDEEDAAYDPDDPSTWVANWTSGEAGDSNWNAKFNWAAIWWQPMDMLYFSLGAYQEVSRYRHGYDDNINAGAAGDYFRFHGRDNVGGHFEVTDGQGGFGPTNDEVRVALPDANGPFNGMQLSIIPMEGFWITVNWNHFTGVGKNSPEYKITSDLADTIAIQAAYQIPGLGMASVTFKNATSDDKSPEYDEGATRDIGILYAQDINDQLFVQGSLAFRLPVNSDVDFPGIGVSVVGRYAVSNELNVGGRIGAWIGVSDPEPIKLGFEVAVSYLISEGLTFYLPVMFGMELGKDTANGGDSSMNWGVTPYIEKALGEGNVKFWAGADIFSSTAGTDDPYMNWAVVTGLNWAY